MPADIERLLILGRRGLNLRDHLGSLAAGELSDALNWQLSRAGDLVKRLGFVPVGTGTAPAAVLEATVFSLSSGTNLVVAACTNGKVYSTADGTTWTERATGLSVSARPSFAQYLDVLYMANGVDALQSWNGVAASMSAVASAPVGAYLAVWRNRLWICQASQKTVWWSAAGDPTNWTNTFNNVVFPDFDVLTGIAAAPNIGADSTAGDGILVFAGHTGFSRIVDDSDNASGIIVGGANVLVDAENGAVSHWTVWQVEGRAYYLGHDGVYSTDGHSAARLESKKIGPIFSDLLDYAHVNEASGAAFNGRYYLAFRAIGSISNTRTIELYIDLPPDDEGQHPWMAHDIPASVFMVYPGSTGQRLYFIDDSAGDTGRLRWAFQGGSDADNVSDTVAITCLGRTGGENFGIVTPKEIRRASIIGRGIVTLAVYADFAPGAGEQRTFVMDAAADTWDATNDVWGADDWGPLGGVTVERKYFDLRGRYFTFEVRESSKSIGVPSDVLGITVASTGGATIEALDVTLIPLDCA